MRKIFTEHCMQRIIQRRIDIKQVHETVDNPDNTTDISTPQVRKMRFEKTFPDNTTIIAICEVSSEAYKIVTAWKKEDIG